MKKLFKLVVIALFVLLLVGCDDDMVYKTEYKTNEEAIIDNLYVSIDKVDYIDTSGTFELNFKITNKRGSSVTIDPSFNFRIYSNDIQLDNIYPNSTNIINNNETINYKLNYKIDLEDIEYIMFYSGIVENNIKFVINSNDI